MSRISRIATPFRVVCHEDITGASPGCGGSYLTQDEYTRQVFRADLTWQCPICGAYGAEWDDINYELMLRAQQYNDNPELEQL